MARTAQLSLPLVMPAQAQKHVTVNEALARLDATAQLRFASSLLAVPPASASDGESYLIPPAASGVWQGRSAQIAVWSNGGWTYLEPRVGWRAWDVSLGANRVFDGADWVPHAAVVTGSGAATSGRIIEFDHVIVAGPINQTTIGIPGSSQVLGVTGRVVADLTGGLAGWRIGVAGSDNRYGSGLGTAVNSYLLGLSGSPVTYYSSEPLLLTAEGGVFVGGIIRLAIHLIELSPPRAV